MAHIPVLFDACMNNLAIKSDGTYLDLTMGGFGHASGICERLSEKGTYIGIDKDPDAIERCSKKAALFKCTTYLLRCDFKDYLPNITSIGIGNIDGCLIDLGVSSFQLDEADRGFSFLNDGPLDMRMDTTAELSAWNVVNEYPLGDIERILRTFGEERFSSRIASAILRARENSAIDTTSQLADIVERVIPYKLRQKGKHPATRTFQAIRIEVNSELDGLDKTLDSVIDILNPEGRLCVISFHSLEDRIVKETFSMAARGCICPKEFPVCVCGKKPTVKLLKDISPNEEELKTNPRSRSARLRTAVKL